MTAVSVLISSIWPVRFKIKVPLSYLILLSHWLAGKGFWGSPDCPIGGSVSGQVELLHEIVRNTQHRPPPPWYDHCRLVHDCLFGMCHIRSLSLLDIWRWLPNGGWSPHTGKSPVVWGSLKLWLSYDLKSAYSKTLIYMSHFVLVIIIFVFLFQCPQLVQ